MAGLASLDLNKIGAWPSKKVSTQKVSHVQVIRMMCLTGLDTPSRYKKMSQAGLPLKVIAC